MMRKYEVNDGAKEFIIALGSYNPVKAFAKVRFDKTGDIYWINPQSYDGEPDEHLSIHRSGTVLSTVQGSGDKIKRSQRLLQLNNATVVQILREDVRLSEDYFYEGLVSIKKPKSRQIIVDCLDPKVVGSTMRLAVDLVKGSAKALISATIKQRLPFGGIRDHLLSFVHHKRTLVVYIEFAGGVGPVDETRLKEVDARKLTHMKVCLFDTISVSDKLSPAG